MCWSSKGCAKWIQTRLPSVCSVCSFNRTHSHKLRVSLWLPSGWLFLLLRALWEVTWLGSYLEDIGWLHNHMERTICRHVLPLSLLVSRGSPSLVFHQKRPQRQRSNLEPAPSGLGCSHVGKGETCKGQEMRYHRNACVCREKCYFHSVLCIRGRRTDERKGYSHIMPNVPHSTSKYGEGGNRANTFVTEFATSLHSFHGS